MADELLANNEHVVLLAGQELARFISFTPSALLTETLNSILDCFSLVILYHLCCLTGQLPSNLNLNFWCKQIHTALNVQPSAQTVSSASLTAASYWHSTSTLSSTLTLVPPSLLFLRDDTPLFHAICPHPTKPLTSAAAQSILLLSAQHAFSLTITSLIEVFSQPMLTHLFDALLRRADVFDQLSLVPQSPPPLLPLHGTQLAPILPIPTILVRTFLRGLTAILPFISESVDAVHDRIVPVMFSLLLNLHSHIVKLEGVTGPNMAPNTLKHSTRSAINGTVHSILAFLHTFASVSHNPLIIVHCFFSALLASSSSLDAMLQKNQDPKQLLSTQDGFMASLLSPLALTLIAVLCSPVSPAFLRIVNQKRRNLSQSDMSGKNVSAMSFANFSKVFENSADPQSFSEFISSSFNSTKRNQTLLAQCIPEWMHQSLCALSAYLIQMNNPLAQHTGWKLAMSAIHSHHSLGRLDWLGKSGSSDTSAQSEDFGYPPPPQFVSPIHRCNLPNSSRQPTVDATLANSVDNAARHFHWFILEMTSKVLKTPTDPNSPTLMMLSNSLKPFPSTTADILSYLSLNLYPFSCFCLLVSSTPTHFLFRLKSQHTPDEDSNIHKFSTLLISTLFYSVSITLTLTTNSRPFLTKESTSSSTSPHSLLFLSRLLFAISHAPSAALQRLSALPPLPSAHNTQQVFLQTSSLHSLLTDLSMSNPYQSLLSSVLVSQHASKYHALLLPKQDLLTPSLIPHPPLYSTYRKPFSPSFVHDLSPLPTKPLLPKAPKQAVIRQHQSPFALTRTDSSASLQKMDEGIDLDDDHMTQQDVDSVESYFRSFHFLTRSSRFNSIIGLTSQPRVYHLFHHETHFAAKYELPTPYDLEDVLLFSEHSPLLPFSLNHHLQSSRSMASFQKSLSNSPFLDPNKPVASLVPLSTGASFFAYAGLYPSPIQETPNPYVPQITPALIFPSFGVSMLNSAHQRLSSAAQMSLASLHFSSPSSSFVLATFESLSPKLTALQNIQTTLPVESFPLRSNIITTVTLILFALSSSPQDHFSSSPGLVSSLSSILSHSAFGSGILKGMALNPMLTTQQGSGLTSFFSSFQTERRSSMSSLPAVKPIVTPQPVGSSQTPTKVSPPSRKGSFHALSSPLATQPSKLVSPLTTHSNTQRAENATFSGTMTVIEECPADIHPILRYLAAFSTFLLESKKQGGVSAINASITNLENATKALPQEPYLSAADGMIWHTTYSILESKPSLDSLRSLVPNYIQTLIHLVLNQHHSMHLTALTNIQYLMKNILSSFGPSDDVSDSLLFLLSLSLSSIISTLTTILTFPTHQSLQVMLTVADISELCLSCTSATIQGFASSDSSRALPLPPSLTTLTSQCVSCIVSICSYFSSIPVPSLLQRRNRLVILLLTRLPFSPLSLSTIPFVQSWMTSPSYLLRDFSFSFVQHVLMSVTISIPQSLSLSIMTEAIKQSASFNDSCNLCAIPARSDLISRCSKDLMSSDPLSLFQFFISLLTAKRRDQSHAMNRVTESSLFPSHRFVPYVLSTASFAQSHPTTPNPESRGQGDLEGDGDEGGLRPAIVGERGGFSRPQIFDEDDIYDDQVGGAGKDDENEKLNIADQDEEEDDETDNLQTDQQSKTPQKDGQSSKPSGKSGSNTANDLFSLMAPIVQHQSSTRQNLINLMSLLFASPEDDSKRARSLSRCPVSDTYTLFFQNTLSDIILSLTLSIPSNTVSPLSLPSYPNLDRLGPPQSPLHPLCFADSVKSLLNHIFTNFTSIVSQFSSYAQLPFVSPPTPMVLSEKNEIQIANSNQVQIQTASLRFLSNLYELIAFSHPPPPLFPSSAMDLLSSLEVPLSILFRNILGPFNQLVNQATSATPFISYSSEFASSTHPPVPYSVDLIVSVFEVTTIAVVSGCFSFGPTIEMIIDLLFPSHLSKIIASTSYTNPPSLTCDELIQIVASFGSTIFGDLKSQNGEMVSLILVSSMCSYLSAVVSSLSLIVQSLQSEPQTSPTIVLPSPALKQSIEPHLPAILQLLSSFLCSVNGESTPLVQCESGHSHPVIATLSFLASHGQSTNWKVTQQTKDSLRKAASLAFTATSTILLSHHQTLPHPTISSSLNTLFRLDQSCLNIEIDISRPLSACLRLSFFSDPNWKSLIAHATSDIVHSSSITCLLHQLTISPFIQSSTMALPSVRLILDAFQSVPLNQVHTSTTSTTLSNSLSFLHSFFPDLQNIHHMSTLLASHTDKPLSPELFQTVPTFFARMNRVLARFLPILTESNQPLSSIALSPLLSFIFGVISSSLSSFIGSLHTLTVHLFEIPPLDLFHPISTLCLLCQSACSLVTMIQTDAEYPQTILALVIPQICALLEWFILVTLKHTSSETVSLLLSCVNSLIDGIVFNVYLPTTHPPSRSLFASPYVRLSEIPTDVLMHTLCRVPPLMVALQLQASSQTSLSSCSDLLSHIHSRLLPPTTLETARPHPLILIMEGTLLVALSNDNTFHFSENFWAEDQSPSDTYISQIGWILRGMTNSISISPPLSNNSIQTLSRFVLDQLLPLVDHILEKVSSSIPFSAVDQELIAQSLSFLSVFVTPAVSHQIALAIFRILLIILQSNCTFTQTGSCLKAVQTVLKDELPVLLKYAIEQKPDLASALASSLSSVSTVHQQQIETQEAPKGDKKTGRKRRKRTKTETQSGETQDIELTLDF
ncbi:hypothetical protein BLNAU_2383 [Blattamonas nauphoetae]|uniref:HECT-type E3 ubiquitin transferase n=1 Tax=Blattamonas nauphoetae TaxID=2049346 RepID=A0ABQ9YFL0_9EUKA|nr:hypothetical protein BLNAU_2383 [Blattamonas nauphoetae]